MLLMAPAAPPCLDHPVWAALQNYHIGPDEAAFDFAARLARDNGWTADHAARVIAEYRRFVFLAVTGDDPATPSDAVDQAWHLHLTYSRDYWERFCPGVLGVPLHHGPTAGGAAEAARYFRQYADTLARYEAVFGIAPPADIWPDAARRLHRDPRARRVDPAAYFIVSRRRLWQGLALLVVVLLVWGGLR
ncbi:hypothetical protein IP88_01290 [alpha proteobacterium AAP81b]|nr:hypothetical protein IP88_01290 [alpha proteobacterium AAP81b]